METAQVNGFSGGAVEARIRYQDRLDLGVLIADEPAAVAGVFTANRVKAAPVLLGQEQIRSGRCRAIMVNAGIANACTGEAGMEAARATAALLAQRLECAVSEIQVASTGVIGQQLPVEPFADNMDALMAAVRPQGLADVARAMMTTDTRAKMARRVVTLGKQSVTLVGMAKGSGMIMPNMATMLGFVLTDCSITPALLQEMLSAGVDTSFNAITVDGDTSTNDTVLALASGRAGNPILDDGNTPLAGQFAQALAELLQDLAWQIVRDGEGATKFVTITVRNAQSEEEAKEAAMTVANSPLVKTAFFGEDANWGRIIGALGRSGAAFDPNRVAIAFGDVLMVQDGVGLSGDAEARATEVLRQKEFTVTIDLHNGGYDFSVYTSDLSLEYVKINADYRS